MKRFARVALAFVMLAACAACATLTMPGTTIHPAEPLPPAQPGFVRAGTARVDITPPPGVSTFGHGPDAHVANGYWTRLYCRVFAFESIEGNTSPPAPETPTCAPSSGAGEPPSACDAGAPIKRKMAIVPCDLPAMSGLLQRTVADRVSDILPPSRIMMTATHTHAGPAHYFDGKGFGSALSTHLPGFDDEMLTFLAERIAAGIRSAFAHSVRANLAWGHYDPFASPPDPVATDRGMWGISWNRSYCARKPIPGQLAPAALKDVEKAIDPSIHVLEITDEAQPLHVLGSLSFYAMHPSVLPMSNMLLGADVSGVVSRGLESVYRQTGGGDPLAGVVNTNEGDMSPVWKKGTKTEAVEVGTEIVKRIQQIVPDQKVTVLDMRYVEQDISKGSLTHVPFRTCADGLVGQSVEYGACDHPTSGNGGTPTLPTFDGACQKPKLTPGGELQHLLAGEKLAFPTRVPIAVARIGDSLITFLPAELTISAGRQVANAVMAPFRTPAQPGSVKHSFIAGLANSYILYVASCEEFLWTGPGGACASGKGGIRQSYEGAATLYGRSSATFFAEWATRLSSSLATSRQFPGLDAARERPYGTGPQRERFPRAPRTSDEVHPRAEFVCKLNGAAPPAPPHPVYCFGFHAEAPSGVDIASRTWASVQLGAPCSGTQCVADDTGLAFVTRVNETDAQGAEWVSLFDPAFAPAGAPLSFTIRSRVGGSEAVASLASVADCTDGRAERCGAFDERPETVIPYSEAVRTPCPPGNPWPLACPPSP